MERHGNFGAQVFKNISIFTSRLFGENSFAKNRIFDERINRSLVTTGIQRLVDGMELADFKLSKSAQLGYVVGLADLKNLDFARFHFISLWAVGQESDVVVNRASGRLFSQWYQRTGDQVKFKRGYQTALIHFMSGITGGQGFINQIISQVQLLSNQERRQLIDDWFFRVNSQLGDLDPTQSISKTGMNLQQSRKAVEFLFAEKASSDLRFIEAVDLNIDNMPDFLPEIGISKQQIADLEYQSAGATAACFVAAELIPMINLMQLGLMQWFSTNVASLDNLNLIGLPYIDVERDKEYLKFPKTIDDLFARCGIFDLSEYSHSRNNIRDNYQLRYSVLVVDNEPLVDRFGELVRVNYGILNLLYNEFAGLLVKEVVGEAHNRRHEQLHGLKQGNLSVGNSTMPSESGLYAKMDFVVNELFKQVGVLKAIGANHYQTLSYAHTLSSFIRYLKEDQWVEINGELDSVSRETRTTMYWIYQLSFADQLDDDETVKCP